MNLLFLLSSLEPAGSETYALALERAWQNRHRVFWISDRLHFGQTYTSLPISAKAVPGGVRNTFAVARFIRDHEIALVHSHSRRSHWVAAQAAFLTRIPHVATVHQPPPVHLFSRLFPCLGDATIAVSEVARDHVIQHLGIRPKRVHLIRNGIEIPPSLPEPEARQTPEIPTILWLGRLSGHRWDTFEFFLDVLLRIAPTLPAAHYRVAGKIPDEKRELLERRVQDANTKLGQSRVEIAGWTDHLSEWIDSAYAVVAAGRSALESLARGAPTIVLGERGVIGLCDASQWTRCQETNFGDHMHQPEFVPARLEVALREVLNPALDRKGLGLWSQTQVKKDYAIEDVARAVESVYEQVRTSS